MKQITPKNAGQPFTEQDDAIIREMHAEKASISDIAAKLERTSMGITARLERLGLRSGPTAAKQAAVLGA